MNKNNDRQLPFELYENHKSNTKYTWKIRGLNMHNFEEIYERYIYTKECDWCSLDFKNRSDRQMDHCHDTGKFRGILCLQCNSNAKDPRNISWCNKRNKYVVEIRRNGKHIFRKRYNTVEECNIAIKKFKDDNWWQFPYHIPNE